jgi:hypothetical protein
VSDLMKKHTNKELRCGCAKAAESGGHRVKTPFPIHRKKENHIQGVRRRSTLHVLTYTNKSANSLRLCPLQGLRISILHIVFLPL